MRLSIATTLVLFLVPGGVSAAPEPFSTVPPGHWLYQALTEAGCESPTGELTRYEAALRVAKRINAVTSAQEDVRSETERSALVKLSAELRAELTQLGVSLLPLGAPRSSLTQAPASTRKKPAVRSTAVADLWDAGRPLEGFRLGLGRGEDGLPRLALSLDPDRPAAWSLDLDAPRERDTKASLLTSLGPVGFQPGGVALGGQLGHAELRARVAFPDAHGLTAAPLGVFKPDYSIDAAVPLGFADGSLGTSYSRVTNLYGTSRDSVVTTHLDLQLAGGTSLAASLARAGMNPLSGESSWRAEATYSPGSFTLGAGMMGIDPDFVRRGYLGPTLFSPHHPLRGVAGSVTYQGGESLTIRGSIEGYGVESAPRSAFRRYLAGVGYSLSERLAFDFTVARLEAWGQPDFTSTYATVGLGLNFTPDASLKLVYRMLQLEDDTDSSAATSASSVMATQFSVRF